MRIKLTIAYDGSEYSGWQVQPNAVSVQEIVEQAVLSATGEKCRVTGSGRTDAGVHAIGQVAHFTTNSTIPPHKFYRALNVFLPQNVRILQSEQADDNFHACNDAKRKTYEFSAYYGRVENPLLDRYAVYLEYKPDLEKMQRVAKAFVGEHDFKAFCASGSGAKTTVRTVYDCSVDSEECGEFTKYKFTVTGNGFLYNMVRIMVGTLVLAGSGDIDESDVERAFNLGVRHQKIKTLSACGLCLKSVEY